MCFRRGNQWSSSSTWSWLTAGDRCGRAGTWTPSQRGSHTCVDAGWDTVRPESVFALERRQDPKKSSGTLEITTPHISSKEFAKNPVVAFYNYLDAHSGGNDHSSVVPSRVVIVIRISARGLLHPLAAVIFRATFLYTRWES